MKLADVATLRLISQQIAGTKFKTIKELVGWMGAMQAQDYAMVKWAVGVRLPNATDQAVEAALGKGEIIRTHLLRPTWHLVSADDVYWMLELTAPQIKAGLKSRHKELELSESVFAKSHTLLEKALRGGKHLTRAELLVEFRKAKIPVNDNRMSHILSWAELNGVVCSGAPKGGKQTHALLEERVPRTTSMTREAALASLAKKYFTSHGPAALQDFVWWSGLSVGDAKQALEMAKSGLVSETVAAQTYWFDPSFSVPGHSEGSVHLLPAFDEFIISYRDRSAALPFENHSKAVSDNGVFRPVIVVNGRVTGIWKRTISKDQAIVATEFFRRPSRATWSLIEKAAGQYGRFLEKETKTTSPPLKKEKRGSQL